MLAGKRKGGGRAILKGGKVYRKAQRDFREVPIAYKARKVQVHCGRGFEMARDEASEVSMGLLKTMQEVCTKSLRQTVTQTVTKNLLMPGNERVVCLGYSNKQKPHDLCSVLLEGAVRSRRLCLHRSSTVTVMMETSMACTGDKDEGCLTVPEVRTGNHFRR